MALTMLLVAACTPEVSPGECLDPDDPCPGDMVTDDSGCVYDRCAGEFSGTLVPCWYAGRIGMVVGRVRLAGADAEQLAYVRQGDEFEHRRFGQILTYDLATGEHGPLTAEGENTRYGLRGDARRIAWSELASAEYQKTEGCIPRSDVHVLDLETGEAWQLPNPEQAECADISLSGDRVVYRATQTAPADRGQVLRTDIWMTDLRSGERTRIAGATTEEARLGSPRVHGERVAYWRGPPASAEGTAPSQLRLLELGTGEETTVDSVDGLAPPVFGTGEKSFLLAGDRAVVRLWDRLRVYDLSTGEAQDPIECGLEDCHPLLEQGQLVYERHDPETHTVQLYQHELKAGVVHQLTDLRPRLDAVLPLSLLGGRVLWKEHRGDWLVDRCGNERPATGRTPLWLWTDLD